MMTSKVKRLWEGSKNAEFQSAMKLADGDSRPGLFSDELEKIIYATMYWGWLVGKYGSAAESRI